MPKDKNIRKLQADSESIFDENIPEENYEMMLDSASDMMDITFTTALELTKLIHSEGGEPKSRDAVLETFHQAMNLLDKN